MSTEPAATTTEVKVETNVTAAPTPAAAAAAPAADGDWGKRWFHFVTFSAQTAAFIMLLRNLTDENWQSANSATSNTSMPITAAYLTVQQEASTRYIGSTFFGAFLSLLFLFDNPSDGHNWTRALLNGKIPVKTIFFVAQTVHIAETVLRLAAIYTFWNDPAVIAGGLQAAAWGILFLSTLCMYVSLGLHYASSLKYPATFDKATDASAVSSFFTCIAPAIHITALLANVAQIIITIVVIRQGQLPKAVSTSPLSTIVSYGSVNMSITTQYLMSAIVGFFLATFYLFKGVSWLQDAYKALPTDFQDAVVNGPKVVFFIEASLRIIAFIRLSYNINSQPNEQQVMSGMWVCLWFATLTQLFSSWIESEREYVDKQSNAKACDSTKNVLFAIGVAVAWPLWLNSH